MFSATTLAQSSDVELSETVSVNYVMVPFTVLGSKGIPITDLTAKDVSLLVDGVPVASDLFEKSMNAPVSFTILLDGSGSMALSGKMEAARAAIRTLVSRSKPGDDFSLYVFDDRQANEVVPFTDNANVVLRALEQVKTYGKTAFFDAIATMPARSQLGKNPTRAIILLSDGIDNASRLTRLQLAARLEGVSVPIYALGLRQPSEHRPRRQGLRVSEELSDLDVLEEIANETGGRLFLGTKPQQFAVAAAVMDRNLRAQYLIGFAPTGKGPVKYRKIALKTAGRVRSVRVRAGYNGTEPPLQSSGRPPSRQAKRNERKGS
ncbi:MAG TPA: VWA domain-containing protein [Thermoanaerobaculia bacterium]|nr:VWA domain-containing protein [Thermoanaerobaculia bacterium]